MFMASKVVLGLCASIFLSSCFAKRKRILVRKSFGALNVTSSSEVSSSDYIKLNDAFMRNDGSFKMFDGHVNLFSTLVHHGKEELPYKGDAGPETPFYKASPVDKVSNKWFTVSSPLKEDTDEAKKFKHKVLGAFSHHVADHFLSHEFIKNTIPMEEQEAGSKVFNVKVANLDAGWDDKDDEEALLGIRHELEAGVFDFAYIYLTGPSCSNRAHEVVAKLLSGAVREKVRITWLPVTCKSCHKKYVGLCSAGKWKSYGGCPAVCGLTHMDNKLDEALHSVWKSIKGELPKAVGPLQGVPNEIDCDSEYLQSTDEEIIDAFAKDLKASLNKQDDDDVKISLISAAPMTGVAELYQALRRITEPEKWSFVSVSFMGSVVPMGDSWNLDPCSNWYFHARATSKFFNLCKKRIDLDDSHPNMYFFGSLPMALTSIMEYTDYVTRKGKSSYDDKAIEARRKTDDLRIRRALAVLIVERSMFTTARLGVQGMQAAVDIPNRCLFFRRFYGIIKNDAESAALAEALSSVIPGTDRKTCNNEENNCDIMGNPGKKMTYGGDGTVEFSHWKLTDHELNFHKFTNTNRDGIDLVPVFIRPDFDKKDICDKRTYDIKLQQPDEAKMDEYEHSVGKAMEGWATIASDAYAAIVNDKFKDADVFKKKMADVMASGAEPVKEARQSDC